jgi:hypothetical protein
MSLFFLNKQERRKQMSKDVKPDNNKPKPTPKKPPPIPPQREPRPYKPATIEKSQDQKRNERKDV